MRDWERRAAGAVGVVSLSASRPVVRPHPNPGAPDACRQSDYLLALSVQVPEAGYLNIVNVGEGDQEPTIVFPNQYNPNNYISGPTVLNVPNAASWCLPAALPAGRSTQRNLFVAFFTKDKIDLHANGVGSGPFRSVRKDVGDRAFPPTGAAAAQSAYRAGKIYVDIRQ